MSFSHAIPPPPVDVQPVEQTGLIAIHSGPPKPIVDYREYLEFRAFFRLLVWREIDLRYRHTIVGIGWAVLQPAITVLIFTLVMPLLRGHAKPVDGMPYPVFAYSGIAPWMYFVHALTTANQSLGSYRTLLGSIYFPRIFLPTAATVAALADFSVVALSLLIVMAGYGVMPSPMIFLAPVFMLLAIAFTLGLSLWMSVVQVEYKDLFFITQFLLQLGLVAMPISYSATSLHEPWRTLSGLNPMVTAITGFRWAVLGVDPPGAAPIAISVVVTLLLLVSGFVFFRRKEGYICDVA